MKTIAWNSSRVQPKSTETPRHRFRRLLVECLESRAMLTTVSIEDFIVDEKAGLSGPMVRLSEVSAVPVLVSLSTTDISATHGTDYNQPDEQWTIEFQPGETAKPFILSYFDDNEEEVVETFTVTIASASVDISDGESLVKLTDKIAVTIDDWTIGESNNTVSFTVRLARSINEPVYVEYQLAGTAMYNVPEYDYMDVSNHAYGTIPFYAGSTEQQITIGLNDDYLMEDAETVVVTLSGLVIGGPFFFLDGEGDP